MGFFDRLLGKKDPLNYDDKIKEEIGEDNYRLYMELKKIREISNTVQARMPFEFFIR
jgi:protease-4